ncbi:MAG: 50S ribosomal protein L3 [Candidatus Bathyarchaeota archaeon]
MGHRRTHAPRRGSLAFYPRKRTRSIVPRVRSWPEAKKCTLLCFAGYKAGMTYGFIIEDNKFSPNYGKEVFCPLTIVETPPLWVIALRTYEKTFDGLKTFTEVWSKEVPEDVHRALKPPKNHDSEEKLKKIEENIDKIAEIRVLVATIPREAGLPKKKPDILEVAIGGENIKEKFEYAKSILGKRVTVADVFSEGQYVDVIAVSKGKGFQGPIKRFGVRRLQHKSRKTKRGVGCIGPWSPHDVMWSVPRPGQLGFHQRTEFNKRIVKIGKNGSEITPKGGLKRYGVIRSQYLLVKGSVPGSVKRLIVLRYSIRQSMEAKTPNLTYVHV